MSVEHHKDNESLATPTTSGTDGTTGVQDGVSNGRAKVLIQDTCQNAAATALPPRALAAIAVCVNVNAFTDTGDGVPPETKLRKFNQWQAQVARDIRAKGGRVTFAVHDAHKVIGGGDDTGELRTSLLQFQNIRHCDLGGVELLYGRSLPNVQVAPAAGSSSEDVVDEAASIAAVAAAHDRFWCLTATPMIDEGGKGTTSEPPQLREKRITLGPLSISPFAAGSQTLFLQPAEYSTDETDQTSSATTISPGFRVLSIHPVSNAAWCAVTAQTTAFLIEVVSRDEDDGGGAEWTQPDVAAVARALVADVKERLSDSVESGVAVHTQCFPPSSDLRENDDGGRCASSVARHEVYVLGQHPIQASNRYVAPIGPHGGMRPRGDDHCRHELLQRINVKDKRLRACYNAKVPPPYHHRLQLLQLRTVYDALRHWLSTPHVQLQRSADEPADLQQQQHHHFNVSYRELLQALEDADDGVEQWTLQNDVGLT